MKHEFYWRKDKIDKYGKAPIYLHCTTADGRVKIPTGERCFRKHTPSTKIALNLISERLEELERISKKEGTVITKAMVAAQLGKEEQLEKTLWNYYDDWVDESRSRISDITKKKISQKTIILYNSTKSILIKFEENTGYKLTIKTLNNAFYNRFRKHILETQGQSINTFSGHIKQVKAFCRWLLKQDRSLSIDFLDFKMPFVSGDALPLKEEELLRLYEKELDGYAEKARLIFLFLCCTGMRISDYNSFTEENIRDQMIVHTTKKTNQIFYVPYFDDIFFRPKYIFDQIQKKFGKNTRITNNTLNDYIKEIATEFNLTRFVPTSKTGRKTFCSLKLLQGVAPEVIMMSTGHKARASFDAYVGIDTSDILKAYKDKANYFKIG